MTRIESVVGMSMKAVLYDDIEPTNMPNHTQEKLPNHAITLKHEVKTIQTMPQLVE
jgi:hypothetical protein